MQKEIHFDRISKQSLDDMLTTRLAMNEAQAVAAHCNSQLQMMIVKSCVKRKKDPTTHTICGECGCVYKMIIGDCPACAEEGKKADGNSKPVA